MDEEGLEEATYKPPDDHFEETHSSCPSEREVIHEMWLHQRRLLMVDVILLYEALSFRAILMMLIDPSD